MEFLDIVHLCVYHDTCNTDVSNRKIISQRKLMHLRQGRGGGGQGGAGPEEKSPFVAEKSCPLRGPSLEPFPVELWSSVRTSPWIPEIRVMRKPRALGLVALPLKVALWRKPIERGLMC